MPRSARTVNETRQDDERTTGKGLPLEKALSLNDTERRIFQQHYNEVTSTSRPLEFGIALVTIMAATTEVKASVYAKNHQKKEKNTHFCGSTAYTKLCNGCWLSLLHTALHIALGHTSSHISRKHGMHECFTSSSRHVL